MKIDRNSDAQSVLEEYINSFSKTGTALKMYTKLIAKYGDKDEVLFMTSGDMGQAGLVEEMLDLVVPLYDVRRNDERIGLLKFRI